MVSDSCEKCSTFNKFAKYAIFVQTCKILVKNASLVRIQAEFCKICDFRKQGMVQFDTIKFRRTFKNQFGQFAWIEKESL